MSQIERFAEKYKHKVNRKSNGKISYVCIAVYPSCYIWHCQATLEKVVLASDTVCSLFIFFLLIMIQYLMFLSILAFPEPQQYLFVFTC